MSDKADKAVELFEKGYNCSQSTAAVFAADAGADEQVVCRIASGFGGGIARGGDICGAVTGAIMALGLKYFQTNDVQKSKMEVYKIVNEFKKRFTRQHKSIICRELLGVNIGTPEGAAKFAADDLHHKVCCGVVRDAIQIAEEMMEGK